MLKKKKLGIRLQIEGGMNKCHDANPDWWGEVKIFKDGEEIGGAGFTITDVEIYVDSLNVNNDYRHLGYGSIIMDAIKGLSRFLEKPIILYAVVDSVPYYKKMGFHSCLDKRYCKKLVFKGTNPSIAERDMIWIPECFKGKKVVVYV